MLPIKTTPAKETRRRTGLNGSDVGDIEYAQSHHSSSEGSPQKGLLNNAHYPSDKPMVGVKSVTRGPFSVLMGHFPVHLLRL